MRKAIKSIVATISIRVVSRKSVHGVELVILRHSSEHDDLVVAGKTYVTTIYRPVTVLVESGEGGGRSDIKIRSH